MPEGAFRTARPQRLVVMGTTGFIVPSLEHLLEVGHEVVAVYTQPPRPAGRGHKLRPTPVQEAAERLGLEVRTPRTLKDPEAQAAFAALRADLAIVGAYGLLLPKSVLDAPRLGCINLHASLLPRWRGAAPIERAILAGDAETGLSIFRMEEGLDTGPILAMRSVPIRPTTTASELHATLSRLAAEMLPEVVDGLAAGTLHAEPQPETGITYAHKLARDEGRLDFREPAAAIERRLRALNPSPGCWCEAKGERLLLLAGEVVDREGEPGTLVELPFTVACGESAVRVTRVQRAGRKPMTPDELQRGFPLPVGTKLG
ncbi:methionyl-tRNA formyltransferase [Geminicoccaceae bacterium SYSU G07066]|uniref:Methionyl-tRNA formyltransferase n=2 Tax=Benzoatithermus flavus TaxID=3108223 RepID=A0ABU8XMT6_9PROT